MRITGLAPLQYFKMVSLAGSDAKQNIESGHFEIVTEESIGQYGPRTFVFDVSEGEEGVQIIDQVSAPTAFQEGFVINEREFVVSYRLAGRGRIAPEGAAPADIRVNKNDDPEGYAGRVQDLIQRLETEVLPKARGAEKDSLENVIQYLRGLLQSVPQDNDIPRIVQTEFDADGNLLSIAVIGDERGIVCSDYRACLSSISGFKGLRLNLSGDGTPGLITHQIQKDDGQIVSVGYAALRTSGEEGLVTFKEKVGEMIDDLKGYLESLPASDPQAPQLQSALQQLESYYSSL